MRKGRFSEEQIIAADLGSAPGDRRSDVSQTRRLAIILAADMAGYSRLMEGTRKARAFASMVIDRKA
jgi:class 3 adenylate cyclase